MFDGFVSANGREVNELTKIIEDNGLVNQYLKACKDELKFGCTFATLSADTAGNCKIRFHSPRTAAAIWNGEKQRIDCGMAIIDTVADEVDASRWVPSHINLYTDSDIWELRLIGNTWEAEAHPHKWGSLLWFLLFGILIAISRSVPQESTTRYAL